MGRSLNYVDLFEGYHKLANERDLSKGILEVREEILARYIEEGMPIDEKLLKDIERNRQELADIQAQMSAFISEGVW